jgi:glycosyltransferase involved in cell wall biosynthesis
MIVTALGYDISSSSVLENYGKMYPNMFNKCQNVIVVSNHMKIKLKEYGCPLDKVIYSPAGPEESFFNLTPSFLGNKVLSIGRFVDKKAPHLSVLAFKKVLDKIPGAKLIMAGKGPLLGVVQDIVQSIGISDSVSFIGEINQVQQREFLISSSVFIQHSKVAIGGDSEGTPVAILEASAAGVPVVSTRHGGIVETVMDGKTGFLVSEGDIDEMAKAIIKLLEDKDLAKKMGASGKNFVKENFSLEKHITTLANAISGN